MAFETIGVLIGVISSVAGAGGAWGATRVRIRTVESTARSLAESLRDHEDEDVSQHTEIVQRLTRIETLVEGIAKRI